MTEPANQTTDERLAELISQCDFNANLPNPFWRDVAASLRELRKLREEEVLACETLAQLERDNGELRRVLTEDVYVTGVSQ